MLLPSAQGSGNLSNDGSGNLSWTSGGSGPLQTCDASTVPNYAPAVCVFTLTTADILQFDGTIGTAISVIAAPGSREDDRPYKPAIDYPRLSWDGRAATARLPYHGTSALRGAVIDPDHTVLLDENLTNNHGSAADAGRTGARRVLERVTYWAELLVEGLAP